MQNHTHDYSHNFIKKVDKTQEVYLSSYRKKRQIVAVLGMLQDRSVREEIGLNHTHFLEVFGAGKRFQNLKKRLLDCGSYLTFRWYHRKDETKLQRANFCKADKLCPACAIRRAYKQQQKFLRAWSSSPDLQQKKWYYIVIPVRHNADEPIEVVYERLDKVRKSITKAIRDAKNGKKAGIWGKFDGGMGSIEVTHTRNGWNVHLNLLVCTDYDIETLPIKNKRGQISWQNPDITQFLTRVADSKMHNIAKIDTTDIEALKSNLVEVLKYSLKFSSMATLDLISVYMALHKKRLFFSFGSLWGLKLESVELDGDEIVDDEFIEIIYRRVGMRYELESSKSHKVEKTDTNTKKPANVPMRVEPRKPSRPIEIVYLDSEGYIIERKWDYSQLSDFALFLKKPDHSPSPPPRGKG